MGTNKDRIGLRPFSEVLGDLAGGDVERKLTSELAEVVRAVEDTGKAGKLVLTISVGKDGKMTRVVATSKATCPKEPTEATAFFTDGTGSLHRENPRQAKLDLKVAGKDE